jgi:hypothetical protein
MPTYATTFSLQHPLYLLVRPYLRVEDALGRSPRIEIDPPSDPAIQLMLRGGVWLCPRDGEVVQPVRVREGWATWYLSVTCPAAENPGCHKSGAAATAALAIRTDLAEGPPIGTQPWLFGDDE